MIFYFDHGQYVQAGKIKHNEYWEKLITDFSMVDYKEIMGLKLPVISREELINYKKILSRTVDLLDIQQMQSCSSAKTSSIVFFLGTKNILHEEFHQP